MYSCSSWGEIPDNVFSIYGKWIVSQLAKYPAAPNSVDVAIQCLLAILRHQPNRRKYFNAPNGLSSYVY